jgi:hypothetical protein
MRGKDRAFARLNRLFSALITTTLVFLVVIPAPAATLTLHPKASGSMTSRTNETGDAPEPEASLVWQGFHHKWKKNPHRLNRIGSYFRNLSYDEESDTLTGEHRSIFRVGAYNDTGSVKSTGTFFRSGVLGVYEGYVDESCLHVSGDVGKSASVKCAQTVDLAEAGLKGYDQVTVILRGFQLTATSYSSGYNTRGFSVRAIPGELKNDSYEFDVAFSVHPEHSPDRPQLDDACWEDDHCKRYRYEARIYYTLIGVNNGDGALIEPNAQDGTNFYEQKIAMSPNKVPEQAPEYMRAARIEGESGFAHGIVAIQGFSWHLSDWSQIWSEGRYIRDLAMNVTDIDYDADRGRADFMTNMYFSNSGALPLGFDATFKMWNTLVQFDDADFARSDKTWFSGTISSGGSDDVEPVGYAF